MTSRLPVFMVSLALASGFADARYAGTFPVSGFADIATMAPAPDPRIFELAPAKDPEAHRVFVETKCSLWGGFSRDLKAAIVAGTGGEVVFSEWSMKTIEGLEARKHSLRGGGLAKTNRKSMHKNI